MRKPDIAYIYMQKQRRRPAAQLTSAFVFATRTVHNLYYINSKFQASRHTLSLYSLVCVGPSRKPRTPVFSQRGSNYDEIDCVNKSVHHQK